MNLIGALAVFLGGGVGSLFRFGISQLLKNASLTALPYATLLSNVLSTALLGIIIHKLNPAHQTTYLLLAVGFCGGFSTFSTFSLETFQLIKNGQLVWAFLNALVSILACIIILFVISKSYK